MMYQCPPILLVDEEVAQAVPLPVLESLQLRHLDGDSGDVFDPDLVMECLRAYFSETEPFQSMFIIPDGPRVVFCTAPAANQTVVCTLDVWRSALSDAKPKKDKPCQTDTDTGSSPTSPL